MIATEEHRPAPAPGKSRPHRIAVVGARTVLACDADRVVLVSCDAAALARDVGLLAAADYKPVSMTLVDLFVHTPHIECVTVLDR